MDDHKPTAEGQAPKTKPSLLDTYLELDALIQNPPTLKLVGDNLRNYPLMVGCFAGVSLLWDSGHIWARGAALVWTLWLLWFAFFTVTHSAFIVVAAVIDALERFHWFNKAFKKRDGVVVPILAFLVVVFFYSSVVVALYLGQALRR